MNILTDDQLELFGPRPQTLVQRRVLACMNCQQLNTHAHRHIYINPLTCTSHYSGFYVITVQTFAQYLLYSISFAFCIRAIGISDTSFTATYVQHKWSYRQEKV